MVSSFFYEILDVSPESALDEIRSAYRRAAKRNHPDLFPEHERSRRALRMMQINEAYMAIVCDRVEGRGQARKAAPRREPPVPPRDSTAVGSLRDPAYTYYKLGFKYFSEGRRTLSKHYLAGGQRIDYATEHIDVLRLAVAALHYFHKAFSCFERVSCDYGESVWARDARVKLYYLRRYNVIYQRICDNLSKQIAAAGADRDAADA